MTLLRKGIFALCPCLSKTWVNGITNDFKKLWNETSQNFQAQTNVSEWACEWACVCVRAYTRACVYFLQMRLICMFQVNHWFFKYLVYVSLLLGCLFFPLKFKMKSSVFFTTCLVSRSLPPAWAELLKWENLFLLVLTVSSSLHPTGDTAHREGGRSEPSEVD